MTVPAHHTAAYFDADGNNFANFGLPTLPYDKRTKLDHWEDHGYKFPVTVKFTEHEPPPSIASLDDDWAEQPGAPAVVPATGGAA